MSKAHEGSRKSTWRLQTQYDVYIMKKILYVCWHAAKLLIAALRITHSTFAPTPRLFTINTKDLKCSTGTVHRSKNGKWKQEDLSMLVYCKRMEQDVWRSTSIRQAGIECTWWSWWYRDGTIWNKCCFFIVFLLYRVQRSLFLQRWSQVLLRICGYEHLSNHQVKVLVVSQWSKKHASPIASTKWLQFWTQLPVTNSTNVL